MGARGFSTLPAQTETTPDLSEEYRQISDRRWSEQQQAIFGWFDRSAWIAQATNLTIRARAGAGKTTTIVEGVSRAPESTILLTSFGKRIMQELESRAAGEHVDVRTLHSLGFRMIRNQWKGMNANNAQARAESLTDVVVPRETPVLIRNLVKHLHTKAREMMPFVVHDDDHGLQALEQLALRFQLDPDEGWGRWDLTFVVEAAFRAMKQASTVEPTRKVGIDYADMIYLPLVWNLTSKDYELVVVDEAQDMTVAQLELARRCCSGRMCVVGDDRQAIYGFRGADSQALDRLKTELHAIELPLNTTYRCGQKIVERAQTLVPDIVAAETNEQGEVLSCSYAELYERVEIGDFVLSRLNAPLASLTLKLLGQGKRARMAGRDLGAGIVSLFRRLKIFDRTPLAEALRLVHAYEVKKVQQCLERGAPDIAAKTQDEVGVIYALAENCEQTADLLKLCEYLFVDDINEPMILCSTVHRAKGLEAERVFILDDTFYPKGVKTQEENNIRYVAITRARNTLVLVQ